ncbi:MAG: glycosyltransferase family 4 protein [Cyanobacteria bacterium P01_A01_bin.45]
MLKTFFLSKLEENPYQTLLSKSLQKYSVQIKGGEYQLQSIYFIFEVLKNGKPDIFHIHDVHYFLQGKKYPVHPLLDRDELRRPLKFIIFILQILILKVLGVKIIWTVHEWLDKYDNGRQNIPKIIVKIVTNLFDGIITHSELTKKQVIQETDEINSSKVHVVPHGNYIGFYQNTVTGEAARRKLNISPDKLVFLLFGNIYSNKGFLKAIDDYHQLTSVGSGDTFLLIVGHVAEQSMYQQIYERTIGDNQIKFVPHKVTNNDIQNYMNACDCVILPYKIFTTSGVALLSMSFGKACIAPNVGFFQETFDSGGAFLYNPADNKGLLNAMRQSIKMKSKLLSMGEYNYRKAQQWNWDDVGELTFKIYRHYL